MVLELLSSHLPNWKTWRVPDYVWERTTDVTREIFKACGKEPDETEL